MLAFGCPPPIFNPMVRYTLTPQDMRDTFFGGIRTAIPDFPCPHLTPNPSFLVVADRAGTSQVSQRIMRRGS